MIELKDSFFENPTNENLFETLEADYTTSESWIELIVKSFLIYFWSVFVGMVFPRFKIEQAVTWFFKIPLVLGVLAVIIYMF